MKGAVTLDREKRKVLEDNMSECPVLYYKFQISLRLKLDGSRIFVVKASLNKFHSFKLQTSLLCISVNVTVRLHRVHANARPYSSYHVVLPCTCMNEASLKPLNVVRYLGGPLNLSIHHFV